MCKNLPSTRTPDWDEELVAILTRSLSKGTVKYRSLNVKKRNADYFHGRVDLVYSFLGPIDNVGSFCLAASAVHSQALLEFRNWSQRLILFRSV